MNKDFNYVIIGLIILTFLVFIGFKYSYVRGFGLGVKSVCGNITAYTKDMGKTFYCDKKIVNNYDNLGININMSGKNDWKI